MRYEFAVKAARMSFKMYVAAANVYEPSYPKIP